METQLLSREIQKSIHSAEHTQNASNAQKLDIRNQFPSKPQNEGDEMKKKMLEARLFPVGCPLLAFVA